MSLTFEQRLHDCATRGEQLTSTEQATLEAWYAELESQESQILFGQPVPPAFEFPDSTGIEQLQRQIDDLLKQLSATTLHLQEVKEQQTLLTEQQFYLDLLLRGRK